MAGIIYKKIFEDELELLEKVTQLFIQLQTVLMKKETQNQHYEYMSN